MFKSTIMKVFLIILVLIWAIGFIAWMIALNINPDNTIYGAYLFAYGIAVLLGSLVLRTRYEEW